MTTRHVSQDGLCSSSDSASVATWNAIGLRMAHEQRRASELLRGLGVRAEHPDDGWVDRSRNAVQLVYPRFDLGVHEGDLIALGWPDRGYRLVRCTAVTTRTRLLRSTHYSFEGTGQRVDLE